SRVEINMNAHSDAPSPALRASEDEEAETIRIREAQDEAFRRVRESLRNVAHPTQSEVLRNMEAEPEVVAAGVVECHTPEIAMAPRPLEAGLADNMSVAFSA